jgi:hypothetical protein
LGRHFTGQADYPDEIKEKRFHGAGTDTNECALEIAKSAGSALANQADEGI